MKYFFLSDTWTTGRVWEFGGLWDTASRRHSPLMKRLPLCIQENGETLWLFQTEDAVLMVEVMPKAISTPTIGQVVLKRLLSADQAIEKLGNENQPVQTNLTSSRQLQPMVEPGSHDPKMPQDQDDEDHPQGKRLVINEYSNLPTENFSSAVL